MRVVVGGRSATKRNNENTIANGWQLLARAVVNSAFRDLRIDVRCRVDGELYSKDARRFFASSIGHAWVSLSGMDEDEVFADVIRIETEMMKKYSIDRPSNNKGKREESQEI